jgi:ParB-like chromosome segregation protein Spo0J
MQKFKVSELIPHPQNEFFFDDMEGQKWQEFLESVRTSGVIEPPIVANEGVIVSGHQRIRACKELGIDELFCEVRIYDDPDRMTKDLIETNVRQRGTINGSELKMGRIIKELERIYGVQNGNNQHGRVPQVAEAKTQSEIAKELGISVDKMNRLKKLADLPEEYQEMIEQGLISVNTATTLISKLSEEEQLALLSQLPATQKLTQSQVQAEVDKLKRQNETLVTELRRSVKLKEEALAGQARQIELLESVPVTPEPEEEYYIEMKQKMEDALASERKSSVIADQLETKLSALQKQLAQQSEAHKKEMESLTKPSESREYIKMKEEIESLRAQLSAAKETKVKDDRVMRVMGYKPDETREITETEVRLNGIFASIPADIGWFEQNPDNVTRLPADIKTHLINQGEKAASSLENILQILGWRENTCKAV